MAINYYSFGLKIATLSSKKLGDVYEGTLKNNYLYNDKELFEDADLNWYDYGFRNYDPQIGRFTQLDPLTFSYPYYTPYQFAGCEPIANTDLDGLEPKDVVNMVNGLKAAGASNVTRKVIAAGRNAGHWAVSWGFGGTAFTYVFKISETATNAVGKIVAGVGQALIKGANITNNIIKGVERNNAMPIDNTVVKHQYGNKSGKVRSFWDNYDPTWMDGTDDSQTGGSVLMGEDGNFSDGPKTYAEYADVIEHANYLIQLLRSGGGPENGLARQILNKEIPMAERVQVFFEMFNERIHAAKNTAKFVEDVLKKFDKEGKVTSLNTPAPIHKSTPKRPGEGWRYYYHDNRGSSRALGLPDSVVSGENGAPDTIWHRPYAKPPIPKKNIKRNL